MTLQNTRRIAAEVRAVAAKQQVKYADLAPVLNVSKPGISRRMNGQQSFTAEEMLQLAEFFGVRIGVLYGEPNIDVPLQAAARRHDRGGIGIRADAAA